MNRGFVAVVLAVAWSTGAMAQSSAGAPPTPPRHRWGGGAGPGPGGFAFGGFAQVAGGKTVTGAPLSSNITVTHTQKLADGNTITTSWTASFARDSVGRTNRDVTLPAIGPLSATGSTPHLRFITDPVAGTSFTLDLNRKTAQQFAWHAHGPGAGGPRGPLWQGGGRTPGGNARNVTSESLGTKTVNGVNAQGTRVTHTIPAGVIGNSAPVVTTTERWYSPELKMVVSETLDDPRFGTTTMQMTNINRGEPDAALFTVPAEYAVTPGRGPGGGARHGPVRP